MMWVMMCDDECVCEDVSEDESDGMRCKGDGDPVHISSFNFSRSTGCWNCCCCGHTVGSYRCF